MRANKKTIDPAKFDFFAGSIVFLLNAVKN